MARKPPGKNGKYDDEHVNKICSLLEDGNSRKTSSILGGITQETFYHWLEKYPEFKAKILHSEQLYIEMLVNIVSKGAKIDPKLALVILERKDKDWRLDKEEINKDPVHIIVDLGKHLSE